MKVWILQTGEPLHCDGGNPRPMRAMNLSNALEAEGHEVLLWSTAFYHQEKRHRSRELETLHVGDRLRLRLIPSRGYTRNIGPGRMVDHAQLAMNLKRALNAETERPDVAFIGYPPIETAAVFSRVMRRWGVPTLLDVKDQWPAVFVEALPDRLAPMGRLAFGPYFHMARETMRRVTGLSSMSDGFLGWTRRFSGRAPSEFDGVFPLTSPVEQLPPAELSQARQWWDELGVADDSRPRFCFVGSFSPAFDFQAIHDAAVLATEQGSDLQIVLCGDGGSGAEVRSMMEGLPNVVLPGWIDRPRIESLAERSHGALAPYRNNENFIQNIPNKVVDALSLGLPILSPLRGEVGSLISEHEVGQQYEDGSGASLLEHMELLAESPERRAQQSTNAKALHAQRFSFERVYQRLIDHLIFLSKQSVHG